MTRTASPIPVIDIAELRGGDAALRAIAREIGVAGRETGFFSIVNHGIPPALVEAVFSQTQRFFALPPSRKERVSIERSPVFRGYARPGFEQFDPAHPADAKESFDIGPDRNLWPPNLPGFRAVLVAYYDALKALLLDLHRAIAVDLGVAPDYFAAPLHDALAILRLLHYPPHPGAFDGTLYGAAPHTDYGNLTLLAQDDARGLEVRARDGSWLAIEPAPNAFVCNIGDCLMRWSNDVYVSTPHRVVNRSGRERYSVAFFGDPDPAAVIACLPSCATPENPAKYEPIDYATHLRKRLAGAYPTKPPA